MIQRAPVVALVRRPEGGASIVARQSPSLTPSIRGLAWFVLIVGVTGFAGLVILRVPAIMHLIYLAFVALTAAVVWSDAHKTGARITGELRLDGQRLTRIAGFDGVGVQPVLFPRHSVLIIEPLPGLDTKQLIGRGTRHCRLVAVPLGDADVLWEQARIEGVAPHGLVVLEHASFDVVRGVAEALALHFRWEVFDLAGEAERRGARDVDRPLIERVDTLSRAIGTEVPQSRPWGAAAWRDAAGAHLGLRDLGLFGLILQVLLGVPLLGLLYLMSGGNLGIPLLGCALVALRAGSRTIIDLTPDRLHLRPLVIWLPIGRQIDLRWTQIEQVQAVLDRGSIGLRFATDVGSIFVPTSSRAAARFAAMEVKRYLYDVAAEANAQRT